MSAVARATNAWGNEQPDWVRVMAEQCDASSQKRVADDIGYSPAVVNTVLGNSYRGDLIAVEQAVKGAFLAATVNCPVLGELAAHICLEKQRQPYAATNATRVRLFKACHSGTCLHSRKGGNNK
ncbi:MAG: XRE family transcriptional regulator [Chromatiales bacterium]|nr:XRE family transcriptional regulator [Chromatiales bacterium]